MLFGAFLNIPLTDYKKAFKNTQFSATVVLINFIWTPILIWFLGKTFLSASPILQIGFIMLMVTPCTDWYLIFTGMAKGNVPLSATVLPVNLVLQVILLPVYLLIFGGISGTVDIQAVITSVIIMLILPFVLAQIGKLLLKKMRNPDKEEKIHSLFGSLQIILLSMAIAAMFASKGNDLLASLNVVVVLVIPFLLFYVINFILAQIVSKGFRYSYEDTASLTLTTIAKNSPMTLGVALLAFPDEPLIHLIMIIEPLIELPIMMLITRVLLVIRKQRVKNTEKISF
jgi:Arsenite efflux pump ACR3 and related permeases